jgi:hypothetical protein
MINYGLLAIFLSEGVRALNAALFSRMVENTVNQSSKVHFFFISAHELVGEVEKIQKWSWEGCSPEKAVLRINDCV